MTLIVVFAVFGWFYSARVFRAIVLSLREKEFVEAARMVGASDCAIMRSHILPAPRGADDRLLDAGVAAFILAEAGLSFLGLGIQLPTASWGNLLGRRPTTTDPAVADGLAGPRGRCSRPSPSTCSATVSATRSTRARRTSRPAARRSSAAVSADLRHERERIHPAQFAVNRELTKLRASSQGARMRLRLSRGPRPSARPQERRKQLSRKLWLSIVAR